MAKKKTRAADVRRQLAEEEREPSPFAGIVLKEKTEEKPAKKTTQPLKAKKPGEIVQGYDPSASFADILRSFETTGNPYTLQKSKAKSVTSRKTDFGDILDQWEGKVRKDKAKAAAPERKSPAYKPTKSFADILSAYEGTERSEDVPVKSAPKSKPSSPVRRSDPYKPTKSFGTLLDDFENPGAKKVKAVKAAPVKEMPEEEPVSFTETLFKTPEEGEEKAAGAAWSIFGGKNEDYVRPEKPAEEDKERNTARRVSEPYKPTKSFGEILDDYQPSPAPAVAVEANQAEDVSFTKTLFKTPEDDEKRAEGASWSVFGGNEGFVRPEPAEEEQAVKAEVLVPEEPKKPERVSPAYTPTKSFEDILSDYAQRKAKKKPGPVKKARALGVEGEGTVTLFKTPEEGGKRAEGVAWSIYGGNKARKPQTEEKPVPSVSAEEEPLPSYEPTRAFSEILSEYDSSLPRQEKVKTFEELLKEKGEAEKPKARLTIGKLRSMPPQSTLDLHGMTVVEAEHAVAGFLSECREHGLRKISIITGKGLHSEDGVGVLKGAAEKVLDDSGLVREKTPAPMNAGGSGALWVILKEEDQE